MNNSAVSVRCLVEKAEQDLAKVRAEYEKMSKEKDMTIETLTLKVNTMCIQFETLFHVSVICTAEFCLLKPDPSQNEIGSFP